MTAGGDVWVADSGNGRVAEFTLPRWRRRALAGVAAVAAAAVLLAALLGLITLC